MFLRIPTRGVTNFDIVVWYDPGRDKVLKRFDLQLESLGEGNYFIGKAPADGAVFQAPPVVNATELVVGPPDSKMYVPGLVTWNDGYGGHFPFPASSALYADELPPEIGDFRIGYFAWSVEGLKRVRCEYQVFARTKEQAELGVYLNGERSPLYPVHRTHVATFKELDAWREQFNERIK